MTYSISDLTVVWVLYTSRSGALGRVPLRNAYVHVFDSTSYPYALASLDVPRFRSRPAQLNLVSNVGDNLLRRHIPYDGFVDSLPSTITVDGLVWQIQGVRAERRSPLFNPP